MVGTRTFVEIEKFSEQNNILIIDPLVLNFCTILLIRNGSSNVGISFLFLDKYYLPLEF